MPTPIAWNCIHSFSIIAASPLYVIHYTTVSPPYLPSPLTLGLKQHIASHGGCLYPTVGQQSKLK